MQQLFRGLELEWIERTSFDIEQRADRDIAMLIIQINDGNDGNDVNDVNHNYALSQGYGSIVGGRCSNVPKPRVDKPS